MSENTQAVPLDVEKLRAVIADVLELPVEDVTDDVRFVEDLEVDSLMSLEIAMHLERQFAIKVPEEELKNIGSFENVCTLVKSKLQDGRTA